MKKLLPITHASRARPLPLSFAQERLWHIEQQQPQNRLYNLLNVLKLIGALDLKALEATLAEVMLRHEVLRTTFAVVRGKPVQLANVPAPLKPELIDVRNLPEDEQEIAVSRLAAVEAQRPFDLTHGPLLRATLLRLNEEEHVAFFTMHHIISDAWSMRVFVREAAILYAAFSSGRTSPLPELEIQYADYAVWQRKTLTPQLLQNRVGYWLQRLAGALPALNLPSDRTRPRVQTFRGARQALVIPGELAASLRQLSLRERATLFMTLLAAFQAFLSFFSGQKEIVVGAPVANRNHQTEGLIGFFANPLVIRTDLSGDPTFRELLRRVREVCIGAYTHQDVPFEKLVEELPVERSESYAPLFQAMFVLENARAESPSVPGLKIEPVDVHNGTALFKLSLCLADNGSEITGNLEYDVGLFDAQTAERFVAHFLTLIRNIVSDADQPLSTLHVQNANPATDETGRNRDAEKKILAIWQKTLGTTNITVDDNFFDAGGTSFLLVKVHMALREIVGPDLPLMDLFKYPTVRSLVRHLEHRWPDETSFQPVYNRVNKGKEALLRRKQKLEERQA